MNALLLLTLWIGTCSGANILVMLPLPAFSHTNAFLPLFEELARRGHNVTVVSPFPQKEPLANYTDIVITNIFNKIIDKFDVTQPNSFLGKLVGIGSFCSMFLDSLLPLPELQNFINNDRSHFDLVITESFFCQELFTAVAYKYSAHLVSIHPLRLGSIESEYIGNPIPYSYVPHMKVPANDHMSFSERFFSTLFYTSELLLAKLIYERRMDNYMRMLFKYPGSEKIPYVSEMLYNHSLVLVDNDLALSHPRPFLPNVIQVGGLSLKHTKPLPKDLEEFMSGAKDGVIFLSWGSVVKSSNMKPEALAKLLSVFSKLKQRVIMKWENSSLPGKPDNVMVLPWLPQASILSHPNLKVFISHCGIHGLSEALYNGVPILGTPIFADQYQNLKVAEGAGYGLFLDMESFTEDELRKKLISLIYNPSFKEEAMRNSRIMKDHPLSPLDTAVYWIEYVLKHNGARHLRSASLDLPWYKYFLLDILGLLLFVLGLILAVLIFVCKAICSCRKKPVDTKKKSKRD